MNPKGGRLYKSDYATGSIEAIRYGGKVVLRAICGECGAVSAIETTRPPPPEAISRKFIQKGWALGNKPVCPECVSKKRKVKEMTTKVTPIAIASAAAVRKPEQDIRQQRRDAHALIEMAFDIPTGAYRDDYSDDRIAKETGISKDWVAKRREEEFGPLKAPSEFQAISQELDALNAAAAALSKRLDNICMKQGWRQ